MRCGRTTTGALGVALVLVLGGCSGDDEGAAGDKVAADQAGDTTTSTSPSSTTTGDGSPTTTTDGGGDPTTSTTAGGGGGQASTTTTVPPEMMMEQLELEIDQEIGQMLEELTPPDTDAPPPPLELAVALTEATIWVEDDGREPRRCGQQSPSTTTVVVTPTAGLGIDLVAVRYVVGSSTQVLKPPPNSLGSYEATVGPITDAEITAGTSVPVRVTVLDEHGRRADWSGDVAVQVAGTCRGGG